MPIKFNYSPFEEDILITGKKGTGKTDRAQKILGEISTLPYWVFDYQRTKFTNFGKVCKEIEELEPNVQCVFQPRLISVEIFKEFCNRIHFEVAEKKGNLVYVIDELHEFIRHKQQMFPELQTIVQSDRNKGVSGVFISTIHTNVPSWIITNATHFFAYKLNLSSHIDWLEDNVGEEAWLLFPPDKRKKMQTDPRILKLHGFVYRNQNDESAQVEIGND